MRKIDRIALIAGSGNFPLFLLKAAQANKVETVVIGILSEADKRIKELVDKIYWVRLGEGKRLLEILREEEIRYAMMAGKVSKTTIIKESLRLDEEAKRLLGRVIDRRDDTLLKALCERLKEFDIEMLDSTTFVKDMMLSKGNLTSRKPSPGEVEDIKFGYNIAKEMGRLDIGQSVAVKKKAIIAVEAIEGTDEMIKRAGELAGDGMVVVKVAKPDQDMRFDVPVVGLGTMESLRRVKASVLAVEANKVLVLEKEEVIQRANDLGIALVAV